MKAQALLSKDVEVRALRLLQTKEGPSKGFLEIWTKVRSQTIEFVLNQPATKLRLQDVRYAVVGADLRIDRVALRGKLPPRIGEVGIYDYDQNVLLVFAVDLRKGTLLKVEERKGLQPPITDAELQEAKSLALADKAYRKLRKERSLGVNAFIARVSFLHDHPAFTHRVFTLTFWSGGKNAKRVGTAVVDLSDRKVLANADDDVVLAATQHNVNEDQ